VDRVIRDWRGTPIEPGQLVVYGAGVGRSIEMVEAIVADDMLTKAGAIRLDVVRRSYGNWKQRTRVAVGPDRLTVVEALPPTKKFTQAERSALRDQWFAMDPRPGGSFYDWLDELEAAR
jgi:hypothetical protein